MIGCLGQLCGNCKRSYRSGAYHPTGIYCYVIENGNEQENCSPVGIHDSAWVSTDSIALTFSASLLVVVL